MAKGNYCTIEEVELYLQTDLSISNPSEDNLDRNLLEFLIPRKSDFIDRYTNRVEGFFAEDYTELKDGNSTVKILLNNYPVNSISNLYVGVTLSPGTTAIDTDNYSFKSFGEVYYKYGFTEGYDNISVSYNAGYANLEALPLDLNLVCIQLVVEAFNLAQKNTNIKEEKLGDYSYKLFDKSQLSESQISMLEPYKKLDF